MQKRNDLQWLRAIAVIAVVGFHLIPKKIPYGYLGVDIFFVLSGYLMTVIISKDKNLIKFYCSRIKRIFPTFVFIIATIIIFGYFVFLPSDYSFLKTEVIWSISFINNLYPIFHKKQYFELIGEYKFLLHTWSLGVEIQFYLLAPFLLNFFLSRTFVFSWTLLVSLLSFILQHYVADPNVSFGLVFCRMWQFLFGTLAFVITEQIIIHPNKIIKPLKLFTVLLFVSILLVCFNSLTFHDQKLFAIFLRFLIVILTSAFIASNTWQPLYLPSFVNSILVYFGDISYVLYLVHWPVISLFNYFAVYSSNVLAIFTILAITTFIYHFFEAHVRNYQTQQVFYLIFFLYLIILIFCCIDNKSRKQFLNPIQENENAAESCCKLYYDNCDPDQLLENFTNIETKHPFPTKYCSYKLKENAEKFVVILGNSFSFNQNRGILEAVKESKTQFKKAFFITLSGCTFIVGSFNERFICKGYYDALYKFLDATKPDIIINTSKIQLFIPYNISVTEIAEDDFYYQEFKTNILAVAQYTSRLILIEPNPFFPENSSITSPLSVAKALRTNETTTRFNMTKDLFQETHYPSWNRVKKASEFCSNCIILPTEHLFCEKYICPQVDQQTQISMYCDRGHITAEKSLSLKPDLIRAIDKIS